MPTHYNDEGILDALRRLMGASQGPAPQDTVPEEPQQPEPGGMMAGLLGLFGGGPSEEAQLLEQTVGQPLFQDTVFQLIGGEPRGGVKMENPLFLMLDKLLGRELGGTASPRTEGIRMRPAAVQGDNLDQLERILFHESGHISDFRGGDSPLTDMREAVRARFPELEGFTSYASVNEAEHFAEAFQNGLDFVRTWNKRLTEHPDVDLDIEEALSFEDQGIPGVREAVLGILQSPLYRESPVAQRLLEEEEESGSD